MMNRKRIFSAKGLCVLLIALFACCLVVGCQKSEKDTAGVENDVTVNVDASAGQTGGIDVMTANDNDKNEIIKDEPEKTDVIQETDDKTEDKEKKDAEAEKLFAVGKDTESEDSESKDIESKEPENGATVGDVEATVDNGIEERCPVEITSMKKGVVYPKAEHVTYYSETCQLERGVNIILPADYSEENRYPVLYVLHGIFGDENSFTSDSSNKIKEIVLNMASDGKIPTPIIVYPNMYATSDPDQKPAMNGDACLPYDNFVNDLVNDLMPFMEKNYQVLTGRENTWLAGFSMGGRETLYITLCHPELFGYVCAISPAPGLTPAKDMFMTHPGTLSEEEVKFADDAVLPSVLMICCGTRDSVVGQFPKQYHELFEENGIEHTWYEIPNADHDNNAIKSGIYNLMKQISCFQ